MTTSARFADLHRPGDPLILPNAWDVGSARAFAAAGYPALGTTSMGVVASAGLADGERSGRAAVLACARALRGADLGIHLTVDAEDGFADDPAEVAGFVASLGPVAGINLEDASAGALLEPVRAAAKIRAVKSACPDVFINARTDGFWLGVRDMADSIERARRYADAGADGIFLPGPLSLTQVGEFCAAVPLPVNVLASPTLTARELAGAGVARISSGSLPYRAAIHAALAAVAAVRDGRDLPAAVSYDDIQALHT